MPDKDSGEIPKAFVVLREGFYLKPEELVDFVAQRVAPYKKIRQVAFIAEVPKNFSGKILRRVLKGG